METSTIIIIVLASLLGLAILYIIIAKLSAKNIQAIIGIIMVAIAGGTGVVIIDDDITSLSEVVIETNLVRDGNTVTRCDSWQIPINVTRTIIHNKNESFFENETWHNREVFDYAETITEEVMKTEQECIEYFIFDKSLINPIDQNFVCKDYETYIECDSVLDGDGNGICNPNGGETCYRYNVTTTEEVQKNSRPDWVNTKVEEKMRLKV